MSAALFQRVGSFDAAFACHEDYELGVRLIDEGAGMRFVESAQGVHHERTTLHRAFARKRDEGRADILMLEKHPELVPALPLGVFERHATWAQRLLRRLNFERPAAGRVLASVMARSLPALEYARLRGRWMRRLHDLLSYWYWNGVTARLHNFEAYSAFLEGCRSRSSWSPLTQEVDLSNGLELVMAQVDRRRPAGLRVTLKGISIGEIPPMPGAEGLTGRHLKAALAHELAGPLVAALGATGAIGVAPGEKGLETTSPLPDDSRPVLTMIIRRLAGVSWVSLVLVFYYRRAWRLLAAGPAAWDIHGFLNGGWRPPWPFAAEARRGAGSRASLASSSSWLRPG